MDDGLNFDDNLVKTVLQSIPQPLCVIDINNYKIIAANDACLRFGELKANTYCYALTHKREKPCGTGKNKCRCLIEEIKRTRKPVTVEHIHYSKDGEERHFEVHGYPIFDNDGNVAQIIEYSLDVTDRKQAEALIIKTEEEKNKIQAQFIQAQKMEAVGRLAGGVAHDFSNIITTIIGISDLIAMDSDLGEVVRESTQEIRKSAYRAASLIQQLLAFSRKQVLQPRVINLNELIINIGEMLRRIIGEDILLETKLDPEIDPVKVDPGQMEQIIMNLAVNARDAMLEGGIILLETQNVYLDEIYCREHSEIKPGDYVMFTVSDNGLGMDEETRERIFEPFFTTKEAGKGTGLGLSTVYGVVKQSKGFIYVHSEPNRGTNFKIYLPKAEGYEKKKIQKEGLRKIATGSESILLVEDDEALKNMINELLISSGYNVYSAVSGSAALEFLETDNKPTIDLLLTDVVMPEMNGRELAERAAKKNPGIKVLYTSGYTDNVIVHHGILDEGLLFISKPFSSHDLRQKVREALNRT